MIKINRRNVLKGLLATPAVFALRPIAHGQDGAPVPQKLTTLNILFHGPFSFVVYGKQKYIDVFTPHQDDHSYSAGNLGSLFTVPKSSKYFVQGLSGGKPLKPPDEKINLVVDNSIPKSFGVKGDTHCKFTLPIPDDMHPVCLAKIKAKPIFKGKHSGHTNATVECIPFTQVLTYTISDSDSLAVYGLPGWTAQSGQTYPNIANLHFLALPTQDDANGVHARKAFDNQVELLEGLDLHLDTHGDTCDPFAWNLPDGVDAGDVCPPLNAQMQFRKPSTVVGTSGDWTHLACSDISVGGLPVHCRAPGLIVVE
jgi:hypothetical protein